MTFLAPQFLWIGIGVSALVTALHFIVTQQPMSEAFPTARFVPDTTVEAVSRAKEPTDLIVLLLRLLAIVSIAAALSRPVISPHRATKVRIILADLSQSSGSISEVRDSVVRYALPGDLIIGFDSTARPLANADSIPGYSPRSTIGNLSSALVSAIRAGTLLRDHADSISLIVVSAFPAASWNAATDTIRTLWPGAITTVQVAARRFSDSLSISPVVLKSSADDPLNYAVSLASKFPHARDIQIVRSNDQLPSSPKPGQVLVNWQVHQRPPFARKWRVGEHGALIAGTAVLIAPFSTEWEFPADSIRDGSVVARWEDGSPAAVQFHQDSGCVRSTNIPVSPNGDFVIRAEFVAVVRHLIAPCTPSPAFTPLTAAALMRLEGGTAAAPRAAFPGAPEQNSPFTPWLFVAAIAFLVGEQFARRSQEGGPTAGRVRTKVAT